MKKHLEYPECSLYDLLEQKAEKFSGMCALNYFGKKLTFSRLIDKISECAAALKNAGVKAGDSVSVCLPNIPEAVYLFYAINRLGAVANMIHPMSAENEIVRFVKLTESRIIFGVDLIAEKLEKVKAECPE
ncbi:MAG: acyl--CoA ligase [Treponema sp.]|nr:acyl--CoA ligase [Treponema sp.]